MIPFLERHVAALQALRTVWGSERFIVIGAAAIACHLGLRWRGTLDLDVSVASGLDAYTRDLESLGWRRERDSHLRWILPDGSIVDVVPGHPSLEDVSPFVLGKQLGALVDAAERSLVQDFVAALEDPADQFSTLHRMVRKAPTGWQDPDRLRLRLIAFRRGFDSLATEPGPAGGPHPTT